MSDRGTEFYPNISLCNDGCVYTNVDFESERFVCECDIIEDEEKEEEEEEYNDKCSESEEYICLKLLLCYKNLFTLDGIKNNVGFYMLMIILISYCISLLIMFFDEIVFLII